MERLDMIVDGKHSLGVTASPILETPNVRMSLAFAARIAHES